ncbi:MAG: response regulator [Gammaproteobacteria bacterium]|nr:response regulator [Gammaproteobacteria bacterium]
MQTISEDIQKLKILHIDDFGNYRSMLKSILTGMGIKNIDNCSNAEEAMLKVTSDKYDVILCDYNLGDGQNGQQFYEELMHKNILDYGTIFIMVTAENTMDMVMAAVEYRPDAYLNKPFPKEMLITRLEKLIVKKQTLKPIYIAYNNQDYTKAIKHCDKLMKVTPKLAMEIGKLKAKIAIDAKQYQLALSLYEQALHVRPFDWALYGKAQVLFLQERYKETQEVLEGLIENNRNYIEAYDLLAKIYDINGDFIESQKILETATTISPRTALRQQHLAQTAYKNGDKELATKAFKQTISNSQHSYLDAIDNHTALANLYIETGHPNKAGKTLANAKKQFKNNKDSQFKTKLVECKLETQLGHEDRAREIFENILHTMPDKLSNLPKGIQDELIKQSRDLGEEDITNAFLNDADNAEQDIEGMRKYTYLLKNAKGMRLYQRNKLREAMALFDEAATNLPDNISINLNAAQSIIMMIKNGLVKGVARDTHIEKAQAYLDISNQLEPDNERYQKLDNLFRGLVK